MTSHQSISQRLQQIHQHLSPTQRTSESRFCSAYDAIQLISNEDRITVSGFVGSCCPEELLEALRMRFDLTGQPRRLKLMFSISVGNGKGRGTDVLAADGLISEMVYAWAGTSPALLTMIHQSKIKAWNLPFGCITQMIRDCGAGRLGPLTSIGTGTFVDPSEKGGKKNQVTREDIVKVVELNGKRLLWYKAPKKINVALLRGTTADTDGNISVEKEAMLVDSLLKAIAVHNSGGKVLVQVERIVEKNSIPARQIHIPGALVDKVVMCSNPQLHLQTLKSTEYDPTLSGEKRAWLGASQPLPTNERKIIAHRAYLEITKPSSVVNLGVGMPEGVAMIAATYGNKTGFVLTTEAGALGGYPRGGLEFGAAQNPTTHFTADTMLDFYNGGGIDIAFLGMAEVDPLGNVNVSDFGEGRMPGCGGFIDISQSAKKVVFMGCLTSLGLKISVENGRLQILQEGSQKKFKKQVKEKTFAAASANGREILYVTERAVFRLQEFKGLQLIELADGFCVDDILAAMEFTPDVAQNISPMRPELFLS